MFGKIKKFFNEIAGELKKVSWSTREELIYSTWVIIISSSILGVFIGIIDFMLSRLLALIVK